MLSSTEIRPPQLDEFLLCRRGAAARNGICRAGVDRGYGVATELRSSAQKREKDRITSSLALLAMTASCFR